MSGRAPNTRVKVGLIGCGGVALAVHLPVLTRLPATSTSAPYLVDACSARVADRS